MAGRIINTEARTEDREFEKSLRPQSFREYVGQEKVKETLSVYVEAAKSRN